MISFTLVRILGTFHNTSDSFKVLQLVVGRPLEELLFTRSRVSTPDPPVLITPEFSLRLIST